MFKVIVMASQTTSGLKCNTGIWQDLLPCEQPANHDLCRHWTKKVLPSLQMPYSTAEWLNTLVNGVGSPSQMAWDDGQYVGSTTRAGHIQPSPLLPSTWQSWRLHRNLVLRLVIWQLCCLYVCLQSLGDNPVTLLSSGTNDQCKLCSLCHLQTKPLT